MAKLIALFCLALVALTGAAPIDQSGPPEYLMLPLRSVNDSAFYAEIKIGSPGQLFKFGLDLDTIISYVPSVNCNQTQTGCANHSQFNSTASSTFEANGTTWSYAGDSRISGNLSKDQFFFDGNLTYYKPNYSTFTVPGNLTLMNQTFGEATDIPTAPLGIAEFDGLLGLGLRTKEDQPQTVYETMAKALVFNQSYFAIQLHRDGRASSLTFGYFGGTGVYGPAAYVETKDGLRTFDMSNLYYGPQWYDPIEVNCNMVLSTNQLMMSLPTNTVAAIHKQINATEIAGRYQVNCDKLDQLKPIRLPWGFDGPQYGYADIEVKDYVTETEVDGKKMCFSNFDDQVKDNICRMGTSFMADRTFAFYSDRVELKRGRY